jgi:hypothetical protein
MIPVEKRLIDIIEGKPQRQTLVFELGVDPIHIYNMAIGDIRKLPLIGAFFPDYAQLIKTLSALTDTRNRDITARIVRRLLTGSGILTRNNLQANVRKMNFYLSQVRKIGGGVIDITPLYPMQITQIVQKEGLLYMEDRFHVLRRFRADGGTPVPVSRSEPDEQYDTLFADFEDRKPLELEIEACGMVRKKFAGKMCVSPILPGFYELWELFGTEYRMSYQKWLMKTWGNREMGGSIEFKKDLEKLYDSYEKYLIDYFSLLGEKGFTYCLFGDDLCTDHGPMLQPKIMVEKIFTRIKNVIMHVKSQYPHMKFVYHTDGKLTLEGIARETLGRWYLLDALVSTGIDMLHPIQLSAGNDPLEIKERYNNLTVVCNADLILENPNELNKLQKKEIKEYLVAGLQRIGGERHIMTSGNTFNFMNDLDKTEYLLQTAKRAVINRQTN